MTGRRISLPSFVLEVVEEPRKRGILIGGALAVFAAGLVPRTMAPGLPDQQSALRAAPEIQSFLVLVAFLAAAAVIAGGVIADIFRRREVLVGSLLVMVACDVVNIAFPSGTVFSLVALVGIFASGIVLTYAIGSVALAYEGAARATALGAVYGAYGAATAAATPLLLLFGVFGPRWQAYLAAGTAALVAVWAARRWAPVLPGRLPAPPTAVIDVGMWGVAVIAIATGLLAFGGPGDNLLKVALVGGGILAIVLLSARRRRDRESLAGLSPEPRLMAAALSVGVVVGFTQSVPLLLLPAVFQYLLQYRPVILASIAIAPFAIALFVAGPVSGILLTRYGPRVVMVAGTVILALGDILLGLAFRAFGLSTSYLWLVVPLAAIGAGFVISTTVRTAIVFSATPKGLPATAAGYNEASVGLGSRIGIIAATVFVAEVATRSVRDALAGTPGLDGIVSQFQSILVALGTPAFGDLVGAAEVADRAVFAHAYLEGVTGAIIASGVIGLIGAAAAWFLVGPRDPLRTVFDMHDERIGSAPVGVGTAPGGAVPGGTAHGNVAPSSTAR